MRCPKCGYISFDTLGTCKKCNKAIGELLEDLEGTVFEAEAPSFLHIRSTDAVQASPETEIEDSVDLLDEEQEDAGLSLADGFADEDVLTEDMDLGDMESADEIEEIDQAAISGEILLEETVLEVDGADTLDEEPETDLELDFGDIDISDLAAPEAEPERAAAQTEPAGKPVQPPPAPPAASAGLEDLQVEDLDLDAPAPLVSGSKVGDKLMPSVKTGTALDNFDIDLGELISKK